jgi:protein-S-isoprenylcysteine O-methyltransferase Ste14
VEELLDSVRYWVTLLVLISLPPSIFLWFLIHPFGGFWRRLSPWVTYSILGAITGLMMWGGYLLKEPLMAFDFGTNSFTIFLGVVAWILGSVIALKRRRYLTAAILSGLPQVSANRYPGALLQDGIYGTIRHPRYVEVVLWVLGYALFGNYLSLYIGFLLTIPSLLVVVELEERELNQRFGEAWEEYAGRVPRFVPRRRG